MRSRLLARLWKAALAVAFWTLGPGTWTLVCLGSAVHAQTILGTWQGTLPVPVNPRIVLKISKAEDGALRGVFYRIDQYPDSLPLTSVSFMAPNLSLSAPILDTSFQGKLSTDGKAIDGMWTQNKQSYAMKFVLATPDAVWKYEGFVALQPMAATADPAFEVATIKPSGPDAKGQEIHAHTRQFRVKNATVFNLLKFAYQLRSRQLEGGPPWIDVTKFDIAAEPDTEGQPSMDQVRLMLKKLLAERFQLKVHSVQRSFPVYALTIDKDPPKLNKSDPGVNNFAHIITKEAADDQVMAQFVYMDMPEFANLLMNFIPERQIVNETGLTGSFDFALTVPASTLQPSASDDDRATEFIRAVRSLGLKLEPKKELLEVIVVDKLEKPSEN